MPTLPPDTASPLPGRAVHRQLKDESDRRRQCLQLLAGVMSSYLLDTGLLMGFVWAGALPTGVPWLYLAMGSAACLVFWALLRVLRAEVANDPFLVAPQIVVHAAINLTVMWFHPEIGVLLLMMLIIIHTFGALRVPRAHVLATSALIVLAVVAVVVFGDRHISLPTDTPAQRLLSAAWFAMVLGRNTLLDLYGAQLRGLLVERNARLKADCDRMQRRATRDALTGMLSRRSLMEMLEMHQRRFELTGQAFGVALLDIDHFKQVNDRFGHGVGDEVLRSFARRASAELRTSDRLGRYGGEEFLAVLPATEHESEAHLAAERVRDGVAKHDWARLSPELKVTVSVGVAVCRPDESIEQLLARADAALYEAKREGRDRVKVS